MPATRRHFLRTTAAATAALALSPRRACAESPRAPFRRLYNNDTTHLLGCTSPWHPKGAPFTPTLIEHSVDEVRGGADVHLLAPGLCEIPWWPSEVLPLAEHIAWARERYGVEPDAITRFVLEGGDLLGTFIRRCRAQGQSPFLSFRLNDVHHKEHVDHPKDGKAPRGLLTGISRFYAEHPEFRVGTNRASGSQNALNFAIPEVRERKLAFIAELLQQYDFEGIELDFLRYYSFFPANVPAKDRTAAMLSLVQEVRAILDRTTPTGRHRWFSVRIPCYHAAHAVMGIQMEEFARLGVEMFNLSAFYTMDQQTDAALLRSRVPQAAVYAELTQTPRKGSHLAKGGSYDDFNFVRSTPEQLRTTAQLAYARGLAGVSMFNMAYYREHGTSSRGLFGEPPFAVLRELGDPAALARNTAQHYWHAQVSDEPRVPQRALGSTRTPLLLRAGNEHRLHWELTPPTGGWSQGGRLRLQSSSPLADTAIEVKWNDTRLMATDDVSAPYPVPYPTPLEPTAENTLAWQLPASLLRDGTNVLELKVTTGQLAPVYLDLGIS